VSVVMSAVSAGLNAEMYEALTGRVMPGRPASRRLPAPHRRAGRARMAGDHCLGVPTRASSGSRTDGAASDTGAGPGRSAPDFGATDQAGPQADHGLISPHVADARPPGRGVAHENVELLRRINQALNGGNFARLFAPADRPPEFEFRAPRGIFLFDLAGVPRGHEGFRPLVEGFWRKFDDPYIGSASPSTREIKYSSRPPSGAVGSRAARRRAGTSGPYGPCWTAGLFAGRDSRTGRRPSKPWTRRVGDVPAARRACAADLLGRAVRPRSGPERPRVRLSGRRVHQSA
jgi:hypothetical protein